MHMHLHRRDSTRPSTPPPPPPPPPQAAPSTAGTSGTSGMPNGQPYTFLSSSPSQSPPHGLKGLGRRVSSLKPVRMLKTIASRTSLRGHGRHQSASSVHSVQSVVSQHEAEHERDLKEERGSGETDYGKEVVKASEPGGGQEKRADVEQAVPPRESEQVEHEVEARQDAAGGEPAMSKESRAHVKQTDAANEAPAAPTAEAVSDPVADDVKDGEDIADDAGQAARGPEVQEEEPLTAPSDSIVLIPAHNTDTLSLASSSTTVDLLTQPAGNNNGGDSEELKQIKMEQEQEHVQPVSSPAVANIDPFLVDDPEDPLSEPEVERDTSSSPAAKSDVDTPMTQSVVFSTQLESVNTAAPPASVVNEKQSPPPPPEKTLPVPSENTSSSASSSSEEESPELHTPALTVTSLFLPVPHTDPLSALLTKHVPEPHLRPPRDTSGEWQHTDFHTLVMTNNWRALARMARDRIVSANPSDVELILNLWYIRLSSLARLRLFNQTSAECENLFSALATIEPPAARAYILRSVLPFELEVLRARCAYWSGDQVGYLDDVAALLHRCRVRARKARDPAEHAMWKERGARMALIVASQLVEMKDYTAAAALLEPLSATGSSQPAPALRSALARIYLQGGLLSAAEAHFDAVDADPNADPALKTTNAVMRAAALGDWAAAAEHARKLAEGEPGDVVAANNYAVTLLGQGKVKEGIQVLETTLQASPSAATTAEPYLFNLSTMYELRAALTAHRKRDLLIEVAKWSGDGLRTACLKMNA